MTKERGYLPEGKKRSELTYNTEEKFIHVFSPEENYDSEFTYQYRDNRLWAIYNTVNDCFFKIE